MQRKDFLRFSLFGGIGSVLSAGGVRASAPGGGKAAKKFRFAHLTDIHLSSQSRGKEGFLKAIETVNALDPKPDFVITGGDLVGDAMAAGIEEAEMQFDLFEDCCSRLRMPVYHTIGNHDILGWYPWSGIEAGHPEFGKEMFRKRLGGGRTYRSFGHQGWHFILLDSIEWDEKNTDYYGHISSEQLLWLKNDLSALDSSTPVVVVTHIPFVSAVEQFRSGGHAGWSPGGAVGNCDDALQILSDYNLKLVLQGHIHRDEQVRIDDISFIMPGAVCGAWWKGPRGGTQEGFGVIDVDCGTNEFSYHYLDYGWEPESR